MIIIWGWRAVRKVLGTGSFFCPQCRVDADYRHLAARRWFTVFFIPIVPLQQLGTYVECTRCRNAFTEEALTSHPLAVVEHHQGLAHRAAVAHLISRVPSADAAAIRAGVEALAVAPGVRPGYDEAALVADLGFFADPEAVRTYLAPAAVDLTIAGREEFVRRVVVLGRRLPDPGGAVRAAVELVAGALGVSAAHLAGIQQLAQSDARQMGGEP